MEIIGVRYQKLGKIYDFDPAGLSVEPGMPVIVETTRGIEYGITAFGNRESNTTQPLKRVIRLATEADTQQMLANRKREQDAVEVWNTKTREHNLKMNLVDVKLAFDHTQITFSYTADGRVDFRGLLKSLAAVYRTRIDLRQIFARNKTKILNGIGMCGRGLCCATFLDEFQHVSMQMAKTQNLTLNASKISGVCGRLMCCLKYEEGTYKALLKELPEVGEKIETPAGPGEVQYVYTLRRQVKVAVRQKGRDGKDDDVKTEVFSVDALNGTCPGEKTPCSGCNGCTGCAVKSRIESAAAAIKSEQAFRPVAFKDGDKRRPRPPQRTTRTFPTDAPPGTAAKAPIAQRPKPTYTKPTDAPGPPKPKTAPPPRPHVKSQPGLNKTANTHHKRRKRNLHEDFDARHGDSNDE